MERPLAGQWALITGASKGIGQGIANEVVGAGANAVLVARGKEALDAAGAELNERGGTDQSVLTMAADTADPDAIADLFRTVRAEVPGLNILVANAGSGAVVPFLDLTLEEWNRTLALNLTGTFLCCQEAARMMADGPAEANKAIVVVSSIRALGIRPGLAAYAATKAAVNQLVRMAAYELAPLGIRVNALSPGITATPLAVDNNPEIFEERINGVPLGRAGSPEDMAAAALYLCSPTAAFVTGTNLVVDGGESLW
jgi:3-oxoacyl-[acyl-carrier protein] reductase